VRVYLYPYRKLLHNRLVTEGLIAGIEIDASQKMWERSTTIENI